MVDAPAGWNRDPYGRHELRYFDGTSWTENVSDAGVQGVDDPSGVPAPPTSQVPVVQQPLAPTKKRLVWPWVLVSVFVVFGLGIAGCVALVSTAANEVVDKINDSQRRHAISTAQFAAIELGTPRATVISTLGKAPVDSQAFTSEISDVKVNSSCIYYWELGETFGDWYQFCFDGTGALTSKNRY